MAETTFQPGPYAARGLTPVDSFASGVEESQSMMQRASQLRQSKQMEEMRAQQIDQARVLAPVIRAKAQADLISATASIANNTRLQDLRGQAAAVSKPAQDEFLDAMQLADFESKANALAGLQAKYQWMSLIPEYKGFVSTINDERVRAHGAAIADAKMEERLAASQNAFDRAVEVATIGAGARKDVASTNADARVASTTISTEGKAATSAANREGRVDLAKFKSYQSAALQNDKEAAKATAAGDADNAAIYRKHAEEFRAQAEKELAKPAEPVKFNVPGVNDANTPAQEPLAPEDTPAHEDASPKLYIPAEQPGEVPSFSPAVRKPEDVLSAMNQMVKDGAITADQARETLKKLGFTPKKKGN